MLQREEERKKSREDETLLQPSTFERNKRHLCGYIYTYFFCLFAIRYVLVVKKTRKEKKRRKEYS